MRQIVQRNYPRQTADSLSAIGMSPLLARIYAARGIADEAQLQTDTGRLQPFQLLKNSRRMAGLLADAIIQNKKILVVADYDADGATACAVALRGLRAFGAKVDFIVPNRFEYGYGLTAEIVQLAAKHEPDIIITVDNGIASVEGVAEANRLGMQVMVTDHHLPGDTMPDALCIVNPNQPGCEFPSKNLAGVGVMFYVLLALRAELRGRGAFETMAEPNLANLLDLVALGTVADVVRLDDNNRILVHQGLQRIRAGRACAGINALLQIARKSPAQATTYELGFIVGPRLNAAGRLEDMSLGIRCLLTDDSVEAAQIAGQLDELNRARREIEADMQQTAQAALEQTEATDSYTLSLFDDSWHQGVIGILASRLKDKFHRPVIAFARAQDNELKGSGRSIAGLHLRDALDLLSKRHPRLLQKFGGHAMAAGVSIREEHLSEFRDAFEKIAQELLSPSDLIRIIETDGRLEHDEFSLETAYALKRQVWGQGFPQPLFEGRFIVQSQRIVGEKHLKLQLRHVTDQTTSHSTKRENDTRQVAGYGAASRLREQLPDAPSHTNNSSSTLSGGPLASEAGTFDAILFFSVEPMPQQMRAVYSLEANEYNGNVSLQLIIRHWEPIED
jgi:single-stranded-DNA-specific exonuclease